MSIRTSVFSKFAGLMIVFSSVCSFAGSLTAPGDGYSEASEASPFETEANGFFWYSPMDEEQEEVEILQPKPPEPERIEPPEEAQETKPAGPAPFSAQWVKDNLPKYKMTAIDACGEANADPKKCDESIQAYMYIQQLALDKSARFAQAFAVASIGDPYLDPSYGEGVSSYGRSAGKQVREEVTEAAYADISEKAGLFYFYRSDCPYCRKFSPNLKNFENQTGISVQPIALDALPPPGAHWDNWKPNNGIAERLQVQVVPAVYIMDSNQQIQPVTRGVVTLQELQRRTLIVAYRMGIISENEYQQSLYAYDTNTNRLQDTLDSNAFSNLESDENNYISPEAIIEFIQGQQPTNIEATLIEDYQR
jgi:conjugal transfer pilus assembly protein TraF